MDTPPNMRELARELGVSAMTVSRALRGSPGVSEQTAERIRREAARLGYRQNPYLKCWMAELRQRRPALEPASIGFLNLFRPAGAMESICALRHIREGCLRRVEELGYRMDVICPAEEDMSGARLDQVLKSRGIRGLLIPPLPRAKEELKLDWDHYAAVAIGFTLRRPDLHRVTSNAGMAVQLAIHHLRRARYQRVGMVISKLLERRLNGAQTGAFLRFQEGLPKKNRVPLCWLSTNPIHTLKLWLKRYRPDAVILKAERLYHWITEAGYSVPGDIGLLVFDRYEELCRDLNVDLSGVSLENRLVGEKAAEMLVGQVERHEFGIPSEPAILMTPPRWHAGSTIGRKKAR